MSGLSRFARGLCSVFFVIVAIMITSALIGLCTLYVASSANCQDYVVPTESTYAAQIATVSARNTDSDTFCYCNANFAAIYTDTDV